MSVSVTNLTTNQPAQVLTASDLPPSPGALTNSLSGDVALNNVSNYFNGPSVAQGTIGTWFVSGQVTLTDTAGANFFAKLWDGTTVIDSAGAGISTTGILACISLSGFINSPAGNLRIDARDASNTTGTMKFNITGNSKDSTITAFRIA